MMFGISTNRSLFSLILIKAPLIYCDRRLSASCIAVIAAADGTTVKVDCDGGNDDDDDDVDDGGGGAGGGGVGDSSGGSGGSGGSGI